jgi:hypothetical protein
VHLRLLWSRSWNARFEALAAGDVRIKNHKLIECSGRLGTRRIIDVDDIAPRPAPQ